MLMDYQRAAVEKFTTAKAAALFWTMGTGKTAAAIALAEEKYKLGLIDKVLVIAPNIVQTQWAEEQLPKHAVLAYTAHVYTGKKTEKEKRALTEFFTSKVLQWFCVHADIFSRRVPSEVMFFCSNKTLIIVDEATKIKNRKALRTKNIINLRQHYPGAHTLVLTGTALAKRPGDIWAMLRFMDKGIITDNYYSFEQKYTLLQNKDIKTPHGVQTITTPLDKEKWQNIKRRLNTLHEYKNYNTQTIYETAIHEHMTVENIAYINKMPEFSTCKHLDELKQRLAGVALFKDSLEGLPPKRYKKLVTPLSAEQKRLLSELKKNAITESSGHVLPLTNAAQYIMRALQIAGGNLPYLDDNLHWRTMQLANSGKLELLLSQLEECNVQAIIWAVFRSELEQINELVKKEYSCVCVYGDTKDEQRAAVIEEFKKGNVQYLICNPAIGGFGLNLQNAGIQFWYSRNFSCETRIQAEGRSHRVGITASPYYIDLLADTPCEFRVLDALAQGQTLNDLFNNNIEEFL